MRNATLYKIFLNIWPCIRGTGVWIDEISSDFKVLKIRLPLSWRTRNRVGTIFGGSMYGAIDPFLMLQLIEIMGPNYVVWDKAATIRFKRPGTETLYAEFILTTEKIESIKSEIAQKNECDFTWTINLVNKAGIVHAEIDKVLYIAKKEFYLEKLKRREIKTNT